MPEQRLLFEKTGRAKYISHLDLMRTFQRIFARAGVRVRHSEGFNPRPKISIALPLSLGQESVCELLDFGLESGASLAELPDRLNAVSPEGVRILKAYDADRKVRELALLEALGTMTYDGGAPENIEESLRSFFSQKSLVIQKRTKRNLADVDIAPCIRRVSFERADGDTVLMKALVTAQDPSLNPDHLISALRQLEPSLAPDFTAFRRLEVYDAAGKVFR
ncbi:MAG: TIGR03936 family radical SAM-associated protein [Oscillospiraceae bacterium]|nr:TIGR03936 family radical SAM-associated protein [Oscillospiraceae bacterium]